MASAAVRCLNQKGHLEIHAYVDTRHGYSMSVVLVANAKTFAKVDLRWCAIESSIPYDPDPKSADSTVPTIAPCVGKRTEGTAIVAWMGTTDVMCKELGGDRVAASDRQLRRGNIGTDVAVLQLALNDLGADLTVDGRLGAATTTAVRTFQSCFPVPGVRAGVADAATKDALAVAQISGWTREQCAATP